MIIVKHLDSNLFSDMLCTFDSAQKVRFALRNLDKYKAVAKVSTDNLDTAFRLTNSIDSFWGNNEGVTYLPVTGRTRSTSVGDIMEHDGNLFIVLDFGFQKIHKGPLGRLLFEFKDLKRRTLNKIRHRDSKKHRYQFFWTKTWALQPSYNEMFRIGRKVFNPVFVLGYFTVAIKRN